MLARSCSVARASHSAALRLLASLPHRSSSQLRRVVVDPLRLCSPLSRSRWVLPLAPTERSGVRFVASSPAVRRALRTLMVAAARSLLRKRTSAINWSSWGSSNTRHQWSAERTVSPVTGRVCQAAGRSRFCRT
nr:hypothetical protein [Desulfosarcina cetonica]